MPTARCTRSRLARGCPGTSPRDRRPATGDSDGCARPINWRRIISAETRRCRRSTLAAEEPEDLAPGSGKGSTTKAWRRRSRFAGRGAAADGVPVRAPCSTGCSHAAVTARRRSARRAGRDERARSASPRMPPTCDDGSGQRDRAMLGDYLDASATLERRVERGREHARSTAGLRWRGRTSIHRTPVADVRPDRARVSRRHHARGVVHDGRGNQLDDLRPHRRAGFVPSAVASPERSREARALVRIQRSTRRCSQTSSGTLAELPDGDGSMLDRLADPVRQQHERQPRARSLPAAAGGDRRRVRPSLGSGMCRCPTARRYRTCC